jgi:colanic acid biosynthesis protein WcaH
MKLDTPTFITIVKNTPLVSLDLIVRNQKREILLGLRTNEPAKNWWFVPGGRILKNETISNAFQRITYEELGKAFHIESANHRGVFEHLYETNFTEKTGFGTHYIVLAYEIYVEEELTTFPKQQHRRYKWFSEDSLLSEKSVHHYTQAYFSHKKL